MKLSIKQQLFIFLVCFVLLSSFAIGSVMYMFFNDKMTDFIVSEIDFNFKNCTAEIENILTNIQKFNDQISFDTKIVQQIKGEYDNTTELVFAAETVKEGYRRLFDIYFSDSANIVTPCFLLNGEAAFSKYVLPFESFEIFEKADMFIFKTSKSIEEITGIKNIYSDENIILFYSDMFPENVFFAQVIYDNVSYDHTILGINIIKLNFKELLLKYSSKNMEEVVSLAVVYKNKKVICGVDFIDDENLISYAEKNLPFNKLNELEIEGKEYLTGSYPLNFGINIFAFAEPEYISSRLSEMWKYIIVIIVIMLAVLIFCANIMSKYLSHPIVKLSRAMAEFDDGNNKLREEGRGNPIEIKELYKCFSLMLERINELLRETENSAKKEKEMEMKVLGAQINPHFLYNALDSISWMAIDKGEDEIAEMIDVLSNGFRYSVKQVDDLNSVRDEMKFILGYLKLQEMRHKDKFVFILEMDSETQNLLIPKFVIQPLVENFVIHAIKPNGQNELKISAEIKDGFMEICVSDNGNGCDTDMLNRYIAGDDKVFSKEKIGIKNVNSRIKIKFGDKYGLHYEKSESGGTMAVLKLPVITDKGAEEKDV